MLNGGGARRGVCKTPFCANRGGCDSAVASRLDGLMPAVDDARERRIVKRSEVTKRVVTSFECARLDAELGPEQFVDGLRVRLAA